MSDDTTNEQTRSAIERLLPNAVRSKLSLLELCAMVLKDGLPNEWEQYALPTTLCC